jgi:hypothetical protein
MEVRTELLECLGSGVTHLWGEGSVRREARESGNTVIHPAI